MHKLAIIGYGGMGAWHHENIRDRVPDIEVAGVWDIRAEMRQKAAEAGLHAYASLEELLADDTVDMVTIATPNDVHKELSIRCLQAGKATVCEKPVTMNAAELEEVIAVSEQTGKLFSVHHNRRWDRDFLIVKQILAENTIGRPYFIESRVQGSRGAMHGWRGHAVNGGGMLLDWGVHLLDQMLQLMDAKVVSVSAHLCKVFTPEVEDSIKLMLHFSNDTSALLEMSTNCFANHPRWHICGTGGTLVVEDWKCNGKIVKLGEEGEMQWADDIVYTAAGPTRTMAPRPSETTQELPLPAIKAEWAEYYRNIAAVLDEGAELIVKPGEVLRVMRLVDTLFEAGRTGGTIACDI